MRLRLSPSFSYSARPVPPSSRIAFLADTASAGAELSWALLGWLALIALGYMLLHLLTATWIFSKKEF